MSPSKSSVRIVLVDPLGEILFSGKSLSTDTARPVAETEPCPETQRSAGSSGTSGSGTYRCAERSSSRNLVSDDARAANDASDVGDEGAEIRHVASKRSGRVA